MKVLSLDPGHSTGYSVFEDGQYEVSGHIYNKDDLVKIKDLMKEHAPDVIIIEKFALYPWKAQHKVWDTFPEVEAIGVIKFLAGEWGIPVVIQTPSQKDFFNNKMIQELCGDKLDSTHAYDAVRHVLVYYTFGGGKTYGYGNDFLRRVQSSNR